MDLKQRQAKLKAQIAELNKKRHETECRAAAERGKLEDVRSRRLQLLEDLASTDEATSAWAENEIDKCDKECASRERLIEAAEVLIKKFTTELSPLNFELNEVEQAISQAEREKAFTAWLAEFKRQLSGTEDALAASRISLADLNFIAERGSREFGGRAVQFMSPVLDEFFIGQVNSEQRGWRLATPVYLPTGITLRPMVRR